MTWLNSGGQRSRSQQVVEANAIHRRGGVDVHFLVFNKLETCYLRKMLWYGPASFRLDSTWRTVVRHVQAHLEESPSVAYSQHNHARFVHVYHLPFYLPFICLSDMTQIKWYKNNKAQTDGQTGDQLALTVAQQYTIKNKN